MPRRWKAMKDVAICDKPGGAAASIDPGISEWGNPAVKAVSHVSGGERRELNHLSNFRKRNQIEIPQVVASERGRAQTMDSNICGVVGRFHKSYSDRIRNCWKPITIEGDSPVQVGKSNKRASLSTTRPEKSCRKQGVPSPKAKYYLMTDSEQVP
jgi:hypothetical protein